MLQNHAGMFALTSLAHKLAANYHNDNQDRIRKYQAVIGQRRRDKVGVVGGEKLEDGSRPGRPARCRRSGNAKG